MSFSSRSLSFCDPGETHTTQMFEDYIDAVDEYDKELLLVEEGDQMPLESENVTATVINPPEDSATDDLHYNSIALSIEFGDFTYVTTGDAEQDAEQRLVTERSYSDLNADVYQAGHHGSRTSSTGPFMEAVDPETAIVSSGFDNQYGHPHPRVLTRYDEMGIETYWTGVHGDIVVRTDGQQVTIEPETEFSTDPADLLDERPGDDQQSLTPRYSQVEVLSRPHHDQG